MWVLDVDAEIAKPLRAGVQRLGAIELTQEQTHEPRPAVRLASPAG